MRLGRSITGLLEAAVCLYDPLALQQLHIATWHFDRESDTVRLQQRIECLLFIDKGIL